MGRIISCILFVCFLSCKEQVFNPPIPEDDLVKILMDVHIMDAALKHEKGQRKDSLYDVYTDQILTIHDISQEAFDSTMNYLKGYPVEFNEIYDEVGVMIKEIKDKDKVKDKAAVKEKKIDKK